MKTPTTKNCSKTVMRCLFGFAALVLFIPQLSYKFYLCANNPAWSYKYHSVKGASHSPAQTRIVSLSYQHCRPLSIDKRYDIRFLFALAPAPAALPGAVSLSIALTGHPLSFIALRSSAARPLRGPPSVGTYITTLR